MLACFLMFILARDSHTIALSRTICHGNSIRMSSHGWIIQKRKTIRQKGITSFV